jgi:uncharacterized protein
MHKILALLALLWVCVAPAPTLAQSTQIFVPATAEFPALTGRVVDDAGVLDASTREALRARLQSLEEKTGNQLIVATVKSLNGTSVEDYANRLFRHWRLGEKGRNNGVLLLHAPNERKIRIEVGYGLEGTLTDAISKFILANAVAPRFKDNDFNGGMTRGVDDIIKVLSGDEAFMRKAEPSWHWPQIHIFPAIMLALFGLLVLYLATLLMLKLILAILIGLGLVTPPRRGFWHRIDRLWKPARRSSRSSSHASSGALSFASSSGSSSSSWSSSGSSSSGDSFSGGGGGDSGGGGASSDY